MTGWTLETDTRHIPEDELHAYLDQALSRSQCVEIECHLAECRRCQIERNNVAMVRDRTTALLADATPRRIQVPDFAVIAAAHHQRRLARVLATTRLKRAGLLAAGIAAAVGAGWLTGGLRSAPAGAPPVAEVAATESTPVVLGKTLVAIGPVTLAGDSVAMVPLVAQPVVVASAADRGGRRLVAASPRPTEGVLQVSSIAPDGDALALDGFWQAVDLQQALDETGGNLPRIDGLPIVDIQIQRGSGDQRPIVVVAQQHPAGIIRTIEGPWDRVEELIEKQAIRAPASWRASVPSMTNPDYLADGAVGAKRGYRMLTVTGSLPVDSLNLMAKGIDGRD